MVKRKPSAIAMALLLLIAANSRAVADARRDRWLQAMLQRFRRQMAEK